MMEEQEHLIRQLDEARAELQAALADLDTQTELYPGWTVHHLLAHISGWDQVVVPALQAHAAGEAFTPTVLNGINAYNAQSVAARQAMSDAQVRTEWEQLRAQFKAALAAMPPARLQAPMLFPWGQTGTVEQLVAIFHEHEKEHAQEIRQQQAQGPDQDGLPGAA